MRAPLTAALIASLAGLPAGAQPLATPAAACEPQDPTTAEVNAREGVRLAKAGRFGEAVPLFRMAVRLDECAPEHRLLLARALSRADERAEARARYAEVLDRHPGSLAAQRAQAELDALNAEPEPEPEVPADPPEVSDASGASLGTERALEPQPPWRLIGYSAAGLGLVLAGVGLWAALDAQQADDDLQTAARGTDRARYDDLVDRRASRSSLAYVMYGVGGAALIGGLVTALVLPGMSDDDADATAGGFAPLPEGGGLVTLGGRF